MTNEERKIKREEIERLFCKCPEALSPNKAARWMPVGKNKIYELIHTGELNAFVYRNHYIILKEDLIEYLLDHCDEPSPHEIINRTVAERSAKRNEG